MRPNSALSIQHSARILRRGFNLVELVIALAITATLLTSVMVALNASFMAYQATTEVASTHTIGRLTMHRMLALIRTGKDFGPLPPDPMNGLVESDQMEFITPNGQLIVMRWDEPSSGLYVAVDGGQEQLLLGGVIAQYRPDDPDDPLAGTMIMPFTMEFVKGRYLHRATIDMTIQPDDNMHVDLDGNNQQIIRLVASAMPRVAAY